MDLKLKILASCSGKNYSSLVEAYGQSMINSLIAEGLIAKLGDNTVVRTELGLSLSKPMTSATNEKLGTEGYQLIVDAESYNGEGQMLHS